VHLVRQNHLDVLVSCAIKANLGRAHLLSGQSTPENIKVELKTKKLIQQLEWLRRKQNLARKLLVWCNLPHLEVVYENLFRDKTHFQPILDFLSIISDDHLGQSNLVKIRRGGQRDVIMNYDEVQEALANTKFAAFLE
jgi:hypothetical protein